MKYGKYLNKVERAEIHLNNKRTRYFLKKKDLLKIISKMLRFPPLKKNLKIFLVPQEKWSVFECALLILAQSFERKHRVQKGHILIKVKQVGSLYL